MGGGDSTYVAARSMLLTRKCMGKGVGGRRGDEGSSRPHRVKSMAPVEDVDDLVGGGAIGVGDSRFSLGVGTMAGLFRLRRFLETLLRWRLPRHVRIGWL